MQQSNPMTDTQLEQLADELDDEARRFRSPEPGFRDSILAALKSVQNSLPSLVFPLARNESGDFIENAPPVSPSPPSVEPADAANRESGAYWLIYYEDCDVAPELFTDEAAAHERFASRLQSWSCHLFKQVAALPTPPPQTPLPICGTHTERKGREGLPDLCFIL